MQIIRLNAGKPTKPEDTYLILSEIILFLD